MTPDGTFSSGAITAFLRGIEGRAALFTELQCGDAAAGQATVAATSRVFTQLAPTVPMADWPGRYWALLLAAPALRRPAPDQAWPAPWAPLAALGNGPRAALLLRLVAALDMGPAAAALGVPEDAYRAALQRAIPYREDDTPDRDAWQAWAMEVRARLAGERAAQSDATVAQVAHAAPLAQPAPTPPRRGKHRIAIAIAAVLASASAIGIGVFSLRPQWIDHVRGRDADLARVRPLPPADEPLGRYDADFAAWTDRDFRLLADPDGLRQAESFPLFAWFAAQLSVAPAADASVAAAATTSTIVPAAELAQPTNPLPPSMQRVDPVPTPFDATVPDAMARQIARIPAPLQGEMRQQALAWSAWAPAQRTAFVQRAAQWQARTADDRARSREAYVAWRQLDAVAVEAIVAAQARFNALPPMEQSRLRAQFELQDALAQRGWLLGPAIGADYPRLQPLLAQLPESQHAPMLRALRRMSAGERTDLAVLAQRIPPQARAELVQGLLSTSDDNRGAWLHARLDQ